MEETNVTWDEAITSGNYIKLETDETKIITLTNWQLNKVTKSFNNETKELVEFHCDVVEEDGKPVEKTFTTTSNRLKLKLKEVLQNTKPEDLVKISMIKVGEKFGVQYSVKQI